MNDCLVCGRPVAASNDCPWLVHDACVDELKRRMKQYGVMLGWARRAHFLLRVAQDDMRNLSDIASVKRCVDAAPVEVLDNQSQSKV